MSTLEKQLVQLKMEYRDLGTKYRNCQAKEMKNYLLEAELMKMKIKDIEYYIFCNDVEAILEEKK